jgi:hypothetical protein
MSKTDPPFRADHVGSLLRTPAIHEGRARFRVNARSLLRALGWGPGHRVDIAVTEGVLVVGSAVSGLHVLGDRGNWRFRRRPGGCAGSPRARRYCWPRRSPTMS